ncbi:MAG: hypothetical protein ACREPE_04185 [Lysobacter sp.]
MNVLKTTLLATALFASFPMVAQAESQFVAGAGNAEAKLDFRITIPRILFLRVGSSNATVDLIDFAPAAATLGDSSVVAGVGGDLGGGAVTAQVRGNNGTITLVANTAGALSNGAGDTIPYSQIITTPTALNSALVLGAPTLANGASAPVTVTPAAGTKVIDRDARWTFTYANSAVVAPGTYGGVNTNNGRVTYTASMP